MVNLIFVYRHLEHHQIFWCMLRKSESKVCHVSTKIKFLFFFFFRCRSTFLFFCFVFLGVKREKYSIYFSFNIQQMLITHILFYEMMKKRMSEVVFWRDCGGLWYFVGEDVDKYEKLIVFATK